MPIVAPSPPELPPAVRAGLYGHNVGPRYEHVSRCISDCGFVVSRCQRGLQSGTLFDVKGKNSSIVTCPEGSRRLSF